MAHLRDRFKEYVDHNILQKGFENADDHKFLQTFAAKHGIRFSRPGNGICHQVNLERFSSPGKILLGSDSHTPTAGGAGMMGFGVGGQEPGITDTRVLQNAVAYGALLAAQANNFDEKAVQSVLEHIYTGGKAKFIPANLGAAKRGFDHIQQKLQTAT